ncbi:hypothetical protein BGZ73_008341 [Actinomortierella ambigua]|nr:hypothetical protein BGZ73_008341 [Actinomortierella ambigua]
MNALVNYSDDDSDSDQELPTQKQPSVANSAPTHQDDNDDDILAKLKELQSFAAMVGSDDDEDGSVPPPPPPPATEEKDNAVQDSALSESHTAEDNQDAAEDQEDQDRVFASFIDEINAVPTTTLVQTHPPPPPPTPPRLDTDDIPPPPPPLPSDALQVPSAEWIAANLPGIETPQAVYSRLHSLSLLPGTAMDQKDTERRMIEFAIRIFDWEQGGLRPEYFLGEEYARQLAETATRMGESSLNATPSSLPPFGGVVGAMLKHIQELEVLAAPNGWQAIWDAEDEAYGFRHLRTDTFSSVYPSPELIQALDPVPPVSKQHRKYTKSNTTTSSTAATLPSPGFTTMPTESPSSPATILGGAASTASPITTSSPSSSVTSIPTSTPLQTLQQPPLPQSSGAVIKKKAKRKAGEAIAADDDPLADAHIHPSRRAVLAGASGAGGSSSTTTTTTTTTAATSRMPKKVATLLQKWNVQNMNDSDSESEDEGPAAAPSVAASSGANSEQLGSDWRERRLHRKP